MVNKKLILVRSIKGGCGKTTISIALSHYFCEKGKTSYIDADIVGFGTSKFFKNKKKTFTDYILLNPFENKKFFVNDFHETKAIHFDDFITEETTKLTVINSSTDPEISKRAIQVTNDLFMSEEIKYKIAVILLKLFHDKEQETIVIDTTPGNQGLTLILKEVISDLHQYNKIEEKPRYLKEIFNDEVNIDVIDLFMCTNHVSHIEGLREEKFEIKNTEIVINQVPFGFDFNKVPDSDNLLSFDKIKEEFKGTEPAGIAQYKDCLLNISDEDVTNIKESYQNYCLLNTKEFKSGWRKDCTIHIVPEHSCLRQQSSIFTQDHEYDNGKFLDTIKRLIVDGHLRKLCDSINTKFLNGDQK